MNVMNLYAEKRNSTRNMQVNHPEQKKKLRVWIGLSHGFFPVQVICSCFDKKPLNAQLKNNGLSCYRTQKSLRTFKCINIKKESNIQKVRNQHNREYWHDFRLLVYECTRSKIIKLKLETKWSKLLRCLRSDTVALIDRMTF